MLRFMSVVSAVVIVGALSASVWACQGACCLPDGSCVDSKLLEECEQLGGEFQGEYTSCSEVDCGVACRVTGGGVDTFGNANGRMANGNCEGDRYTFGGQAGAPTASQPQPYGEWTHHQQHGPSGRFVFHAGTASAPEGTEIAMIACSDPGWCMQARPAPAKQIDFSGVGTFKNINNGNSTAALDSVIENETFHWFAVHIEDLGEPGRGGKQEPPAEFCPPGGSAGMLADCECPDFYSIEIHATEDPMSAVIYAVHGYIAGGNLQIHPPIGD